MYSIHLYSMVYMYMYVGYRVQQYLYFLCTLDTSYSVPCLESIYLINLVFFHSRPLTK